MNCWTRHPAAGWVNTGSSTPITAHTALPRITSNATATPARLPGIVCVAEINLPFVSESKKITDFTGNRLRIKTRPNKIKVWKKDRGTAYEGLRVQVLGLFDVSISIDPQRESSLLAAGRQILLYI